MYLPHDVSCSIINMIYVVDQLVISGSFTQENVSILKFVLHRKQGIGEKGDLQISTFTFAIGKVQKFL